MRKPPSAARSMFAALLLALVLCLGACDAGDRDKSGENDDADTEDLESYELIEEGIAQVLEDYLDEDGYLEPDMDEVEDAALAVYDYALKLEEDGEIEGAAYCEAGHSVSFFNNDGTTTVYLPPIRDFYSGGDEFSVAVMGFFSLMSEPYPAGYRDPGETIADALDGVSTKTYDRGMTIEELKEFFGSLDEENVRAIFWRGHGGMYTNRQGEDIFCLCINERVTKKKREKYEEDMKQDSKTGEALVHVCDNGRKFAFNYHFIDKYMSDVHGGLFFTSACESGADNGVMAETFINKGFDSYVGTSDIMNILYGTDVMSRTAEYLTQCDEYGAYADIESALGQAVEDVQGSFNWMLNAGYGYFVEWPRDPSRLFRLREPTGIDVLLTSGDGSVDMEDVSIQCLKIDRDGSTSPYQRLDNGEVSEGSFFIPRDSDQKGDMYQIDISYNFELIKSVIIDTDELEFTRGVAGTTIDLRAANLDIIVMSSAGNFLPDLDVQVYATGVGDDLLGLIRQARPTSNENGERVYRLITAPGEYEVEIRDAKDNTIGGQVIVEGDTTVTFTLGDNVHDKLEEHLNNVLIPKYNTPTGPVRTRFGMYDVETPLYVEGIYSAYYGDVDKDGQEELCVFRVKLLPDDFAIGLYLDIYEYKDDEVVRSAQKSFGTTSWDSDVVALRLSEIGNAGEVSGFVYEYEGETYFLVEFWHRVNHSERDIWLCSYDGENIIDNAYDYNHWYGSEEDDYTDTPETSAYGISSVLERYKIRDDFSIRPIDLEPKDACRSADGELTAVLGFIIWNPDMGNTDLFEIERYDYTHLLDD